ncbi:sulfatase [Paraurantiacibacter namhicola]|uniref:Arylsulfatase n=1 Tax=Paraurantiacibacter namhicola TaxID=645517 RepID=A0A1C7D706_9SPHN|nr:sulfatase-like hydrolase/transferase [Paraurantiacibacter namhicola]ANU07227.1 Arylsulfatase precursor [Paraurantiacibacter namhicola]
MIAIGKALRTALLGLIAFAVAQPAAAQDAEKPNIVVIFVDDMAWGDMSANGAGAWIETPHLDALAASGIRFTDGYAASAVCGPSRVGLLTGVYPARLGVWWNPDTTKAEMPESQPLMPQLMRANGYDTAVIGKWNLANEARSVADTVIGPMIWGGVYHPGEDGSYEGVGYGWGAGGHASGHWIAEDEDGEYLTDWLTRGAVSYIDGHRGEKPFFMYLAYNAPHSPIEASARYREQVSHLPTQPMQFYAAMLLAVDDGVGEVRAALERRGMTENTLVFFISDNGPATDGFRGWPEDWPETQLGVTGSLSGHKGELREGGIRVPFVASWPARIPAGQVNAFPVTTVDLYRTFEDMFGLSEPYGELADGNSLLPLLTGQANELPSRDIYWQKRICRKNGKCVDSAAVRHGNFKLLYEDGGEPQFFDLAADPGESADVSAQYANRFRNMTGRYAEWKAALPEPNGDKAKK